MERIARSEVLGPDYDRTSYEADVAAAIDAAQHADTVSKASADRQGRSCSALLHAAPYEQDTHSTGGKSCSDVDASCSASASELSSLKPPAATTAKQRRSPFSNVATRSLITLLGNVTQPGRREKRNARSQSVDENGSSGSSYLASTQASSTSKQQCSMPEEGDGGKKNKSASRATDDADAGASKSSGTQRSTALLKTYALMDTDSSAKAQVDPPEAVLSRGGASTASVESMPLSLGTVGGCSIPPDRTSVTSGGAPSASGSRKMRECPLCFVRQPHYNFPRLINCGHQSCRTCLQTYLRVEIMESRVSISCPECIEPMHPNDVYALLARQPFLIERYETFMLRRVLMKDADTRWCPAPDCTYAVIANSCAACPQLRCDRPGCGTLFCYHCKGMWHANQTCDEARARNNASMFRRGSISQPSPPRRIRSSGAVRDGSNADRDSVLKLGDIRACPRCSALIAKMNDGSCNHMVCAICSAQFCWLCLKEITDLHYLSPTGCTFWGKKPWTRKKKLLWQIGTLIGAPVGIALIAGLAVPGIICGVPVFIGRKAYQRFSHLSKTKRRLVTAASVAGSLIVSPVLAVMAVGVGVPIMLAYVYGVVPLSLCRNGGCGGSDQPSEVYGEDEDDEIHKVLLGERPRRSGRRDQVDGSSVFTLTSQNSSTVGGGAANVGGSRSLTSSKVHIQAEVAPRRRPSLDSEITSLGEKVNTEDGSVRAVAGSHYNYHPYDDKSVHSSYLYGSGSYHEDGASIKGHPGSVMDNTSDTTSARFAHTLVHSMPMGDDQPSTSQVCYESRSIPKSNAASNDDGGRKFRMLGRQRTKSRSPSNSQIHFLQTDCCTSGSDVMVVSSEKGNACNSVVVTTDAQSAALGHYGSARLSAPTDLGIESSDAPAEGSHEYDPYKVRALMDNLKQILSEEVTEEERRKSKHSKKSSSRHSSTSVARSNSSKSYPFTSKKKPKRRNRARDPASTQRLLTATGAPSGMASGSGSPLSSPCATSHNGSAGSGSGRNSVADASKPSIGDAGSEKAQKRSLFARLFRRGSGKKPTPDAEKRGDASDK
ncbi:IBR domain containing protein [Aphelenchoides avenae]|nr:IBR domain containing protein [Aphelenchus avenae]